VEFVVLFFGVSVAMSLVDSPPTGSPEKDLQGISHYTSLDLSQFPLHAQTRGWIEIGRDGVGQAIEVRSTSLVSTDG